MNPTRTLLTLLVCAGLAACGSSVELDESKDAVVESRDTGAAGAGAGGIGDSSRTVQQIDAGQQQQDPLNDPAGVLAKRSVYFDFDSFVVRDEYRPLVEAHARYLTTNRGRRIAIQGNTDDRGSREYNLALGQKRAEAVRRSLAVLGVGDQQMEAVSFGEERPRASGNDEAAHAENRRADIVYQ
ncbi:MAG: peptidoglycan-associated lipoprotein Pal [Burkholderiaceae bacterium]|nr:peptidoglycan-associated lipoprotein Pal [Burkholderiaceae bacterium]